MGSYKELFIYLLLLVIGIILGNSILPPLIIIAFIAILVAFVFYFLFIRKIEHGFGLLLFVLYLEPYSRAYLDSIPYLFIPYLLISIVIFLLFRGYFKFSNNNYFLLPLILYTALEVIDAGRFIKWDYTRGIVIQSLAFCLMVFAGAKIKFNEFQIFHIIKRIVQACILLSGIVLSAHLRGEIEYETYSNIQSSNGMAPVQLSYYLSLGAFFIFFIWSMTSSKIKKTYLIIFFSLIVTLMVLTFSRGGVYFLIAMLVIYTFRDFKNFHKRLLYILVVAVIGYGIFIFVENRTQGLVVDRYEQEGASDREVLVFYGIKIFLDNPLIGVGTGNYYEVVALKNYFGHVSGAHNEIIRAIAEHGLIGGILYISFLISTAYHIWIYRRNKLYLVSLILILSFFMASIHNGLKLGLQSFTFCMGLTYFSFLQYRNKRELYTRRHIKKIQDDIIMNTSEK